MAFRQGSLVALVVVSLVACGAGHEAVGGSDELVGGTLARAGELPSTLVLRKGCTVAKVGPRHLLTAAHCVYNGPARDVRAEYAPGAVLHVGRGVTMDNAAEPEAAGYRAVTVARTHVQGAYFEERGIDGWPRVLLDSAPPDLALVELDAASAETLADVPEAEVDLAPVDEGASVVVGGYGCEHGLEGAKSTTVRLRRQTTRTTGPAALLHEGSFVKDLAAEQARNLVRQYLVTPGRGGVRPVDERADAGPGGVDGGADELASLCPGDSGGPVYLDDGTARRVVGVNAYYSFLDASVDPARIARTNWHTRLDAASRFDTGSWLATLGVRVAHGAPTAHFDDCAPSPTSKRLLCGAFRAYVEAAGGETAFGAPTREARWEPRGEVWRWTQRFGERDLLVDADASADAASPVVRVSDGP